MRRTRARASWIALSAGVGGLLACQTPSAQPTSWRDTTTVAPVVDTSAHVDPHLDPPAASGSAVTAAPRAPLASSASASGPARHPFDFEDADLPELVRLVSAITGKRFLATGQLPKVHATVRSPAPVTADEAYAAFLSILQQNGLTIVLRGDLHVIVASASLINR